MPRTGACSDHQRTGKNGKHSPYSVESNGTKMKLSPLPWVISHGDDSSNDFAADKCEAMEHQASPMISSEELWHLLEDFVKRFLRGFFNGVGLYAGVRVVTSLLRNPFRESIPVIWQDVMSRDCAAVAGFLGLYPSVYHLLVQLLTRLRNCTDGWNYGLAGGLGGLSVALLDVSRRQTLAFFTLSRALGAAVSTLVTRGHLRNIPYFEVGVFSACVSLIVYCTAMAPQYLNRGYYRSIIKWSRDYTDAKMTRAFRESGPRFLTCAEIGLHEGSCTIHRLKDLLHSLSGFAKLYLPIHVAPILVFKRSLLLKRPIFVLGSLAKNLALSTSFLGLMVFLAKLVICLLRNAEHRPPPLPGYIPALAGAVCGLALLLERFSRRKELALFVIPHVFNILYVAAGNSQLLRPVLQLPHGFTLVFALSMTSVMHAYEREPESLTLLINGILRFFFGTRSSSSPQALPGPGRKSHDLVNGRNPNRKAKMEVSKREIVASFTHNEANAPSSKDIEATGLSSKRSETKNSSSEQNEANGPISKQNEFKSE
ncbi:mitochondrial import inner membrane translocase subunit tim17/tim22/tim23 family protein isoform 2 [Plakobranchus ocellatus]|uniref:Mitochondrial import inner membrane translocase subunit tim17/tim22/tim23 family protein isoform 2 n=1 Tax=Plakobranchus ocellatus TaxID=259542 RepID=A0AAV3YR36_9GAST|nr:mitochondrial import inner membrane translocase subunit tim17/tim22/tim23 family protein isoform 2 [Plakobranchus ocellatus]